MSWARKTHRNIHGECVWVVVWLRDEVGGAVCRERGRRAAVGGAAVGQGRHGGGAVAATWHSFGACSLPNCVHFVHLRGESMPHSTHTF